MILFVLRYWPTATETFVHDEIRDLATTGPVALAAFDPREDVGAAPPAPLHAQPHRWGWLPWLPALLIEALRGRAPARVLWLAALLRRERVARVHVHFAGEAAEWARAASRRVGVPYSVTVHAVDLYKPRPALPEVLRDAVGVATISARNRDELRARLGLDAVIVPSGVDLPARPAAPLGDLVLSVGRWVPKKGLDLYAEVARRIGGRFVLVGDAPPLPGVEVRGMRPHAEVLATIATAGLFVLPCRVAPDGDVDGIPVVLLEALAAGVPVVTTSVSGIPEVVDEAVGWVVPPDDVDALEAAVRAALADPEERARRGARGPARLRERGFTRAEHARRMAEFLGVGNGAVVGGAPRG